MENRSSSVPRGLPPKPDSTNNAPILKQLNKHALALLKMKEGQRLKEEQRLKADQRVSQTNTKSKEEKRGERERERAGLHQQTKTPCGPSAPRISTSRPTLFERGRKPTLSLDDD